MAVRALRGATTVDADTPEQIRERVKALMAALYERNALENDQVISVLVTATSDLRTFHPSTAVREFGLDDVPILGAQELEVAGMVGRCVRVMLHVESDQPRSAVQHVFLEGAASLRPDLAAD
jgi:chorismate mutase